MDQLIKGPIYEHRRTKELLHYLPEKSIVFLWHTDLDGVTVDGLIKAKVKAVINGRSSMSGEFAHFHVKKLLEEGIAVLDVIHLNGKTKRMYQGEEAFIKRNELFVRKGRFFLRVAYLLNYTEELVEQKLAYARFHYANKFAHFACNTLNYATKEYEWFLAKPHLPPSLHTIKDKEVFIVARNTNYEKDIRVLRSTLRRKERLVIAVDGAADGLLNNRICPDFIIGDMDSISEKALRCHAHLICHEHPNGSSPGKERLARLGLQAETIRFVGTSEDVALIAAYWSGAAHMYLIGCRIGMTEFLEKDRAGMGATWLARMQAGDRLTDLKGVHRIIGRGSLKLHGFNLSKPVFLEPFQFLLDHNPFSRKKGALRHD